ncbi:MAG TPA: hypothetical protein VJN94_08880 [Candidatus Binataceae bacterium]|nr:hypothetical protein [Candidatus Binataceae bacterium]
MLLTKKVLSAMVGLGMLAAPAGALAADHYRRPVPQAYGWRAPMAHSPFVVAQDNDWHHNGDHHDAEHHDWDHGQGDHHDADHHDWDHDHGYAPAARTDWHHHDHDDDYTWGGHHRYQYPPSYFSQPVPNGYGVSQRRDYLIHQRDKAETMRAQMQARGDTGAENRLSATIANLNRQLRRTP